MTVRNVSSKEVPATYYGTFEPRREQKTSELDGGHDAYLGHAPLSRWEMFCFEYSDFVSDSGTYKVKFNLPPNSVALRCLMRVDTAFVGSVSANVGDADDADGWGAALALNATGWKYDPDAVFNPSGTTGGLKEYAGGGPIEVALNAGPPTAGAAIVAIEVISYHEDLEAEFS